MKYVSADSVETISNVMDSIPITQQPDYLNSIAQMDPELANRIQNTYVTLPELGDLPPNFLSEFL